MRIRFMTCDACRGTGKLPNERQVTLLGASWAVHIGRCNTCDGRGLLEEPAFTSGEVFTVPATDAPVAGWVNMGGPIDRSGGDAAFILALMSQMTDEQRAEAIEAIERRYCRDCGRSNEPRACQCWDDE